MNKTKKTVSDYGSKMNRLIADYMSSTGSTLWEALSEKGLLEMIEHIPNLQTEIGKEYAPKSLQVFYSAMKPFVQWLDKAGYLERAPKAAKKILKELTELIGSISK